MTDKEFLDTFIVERMQLHYSSEHPSLTGDELAAALQLEAEYNHILETLPPEAAATLKNFHESVTNKLSEEEIFYYLKGIKDGLLLYRALEKL